MGGGAFSGGESGRGYAFLLICFFLPLFFYPNIFTPPPPCLRLCEKIGFSLILRSFYIGWLGILGIVHMHRRTHTKENAYIPCTRPIVNVFLYIRVGRRPNLECYG